MHTAPDFDNTQAIPEGWLLNERSDDPPYAIEKLDDPSEHEGNTGRTFACDQDAYVHVVGRARAGSAYHQSALDYLREHAPEGYAWAVEVYDQRMAA